MRVYFDTCCLSRPFDEQSSQRVRSEAEAVLLLLHRVIEGRWEMVISDMHATEVSFNPIAAKRRGVTRILALSRRCALLDRPTLELARTLGRHGIKGADAIHLACARAAEAHLFFTVDDRLYKRAAVVEECRPMIVANPRIWLAEQGGGTS